MTADRGGQAGASAGGPSDDGRSDDGLSGHVSSGDASAGQTPSGDTSPGDAPSGDAPSGDTSPGDTSPHASSGHAPSGDPRDRGAGAQSGGARSDDARAADISGRDDRSDDARRDRIGNGTPRAAHPAPFNEDAPAEGLDAGDDATARSRLKKAPNAFRTISEVADDLHIPQHVLRFWETKFHQVKPMKRGGGRRYYRPDDIALLRRISDLLYIQGYTIKGVQRLLREGGGRLSEDIPPAPADERAAAEAEHDDILSRSGDPHMLPDPLIPGLDLAPAATPGDAVALPRTGPRRRADPEAERLRAVLVETLAELEAIRALLG